MFGKPYIPEIDPNIAAEAFANGLLANLTANGGVAGGNLGKTTHICLKTTENKIQVGSADDGNEVTFYASGSDFADGIVKTRVFLSKGEVYVEAGVTDGAIVTSTKGICGASGNLDGSNESPMPLGVEGYAGRQFFLFAFRNSNQPTGSSRGEVYVAAGAVASEVQLLDGSGTTVIDTTSIPPFGLATLLTNNNSEFQVVATQPVFVGIAASMSESAPRFYDMRLVPPLSTELIGQNRNGRLSALYDNTEVWWYRRNGNLGKTTVSPGSPKAIYTGTINELGDVFYISSDDTPATGGTFTLEINSEVSSPINYDAGVKEIIEGLDTFATYTSDDFKVEAVLGDNLGNSNTQIMIYAQGQLERVAGSPTIDNTSIVGNAHTLTIYQTGDSENNAGSNSDYASAGCIKLVGSGPISCLSGADGAGLEATYYVPTSALTQRIPLYLGTEQSGNGDASGICVQSPYRGTYKIFRQDGSLVYENNFDRALTNIESEFNQRFPCAFNLTGTNGGGSDATFTENFEGGYIEADVPINLVMNSAGNENFITDGISTDDDEIILYGITPEDIRSEIRKGTDGRIRKRVISSSGTQPSQGFIDYNDTTGAVSITANTWTTIPNNGSGAFSNSAYAPHGVSELMDVSTGAIDPTELDLGDTILIRNDYTINPNTNNALLEFRYVLGAGGNQYTLQTTVGRLDDGSGVDYRFSLKPDLIYMGDLNTRDNPIQLQVRLSANGTLTNAGSVIQVVKRQSTISDSWELV